MYRYFTWYSLTIMARLPIPPGNLNSIRKWLESEEKGGRQAIWNCPICTTPFPPDAICPMYLTCDEVDKWK